ncbi:MAG: hypothetical protein ACPGVB_07590 [Chitinophagales bacterium]
MATSKSIPKNIKTEVLQIVEDYNKEHETDFKMSFRGRFAYLSKLDKAQNEIANTFMQMLLKKAGVSAKKSFTPPPQQVVETKLGRLGYNGKMDNWDFAVFKYSREFYDPDEWMFPGSGELDGTIEGALRAGEEIS